MYRSDIWQDINIISIVCSFLLFSVLPDLRRYHNGRIFFRVYMQTRINAMTRNKSLVYGMEFSPLGLSMCALDMWLWQTTT